MAVGSIALYRDTLNSQTSPSVLGTWEGVAFNTEERGSVAFLQNANDIDVAILETGKYLCIYTIRTTSTSDTRHTLRGRILLSGSVVESGYGSGYSRNDDVDECYVMGHAILDVTAGDDVRIEWTNVGLAASDVMSRSKSSLMLVRLTSDDNTAYARYTDGSDTAPYDGQAWKIIPWDTVEEETDTGVIEIGGFINEIITLKKVTRYLVKYTILFTKGARRTQRIARATLNGVPIEQSYSYTYLRNPSSDQSGCVAMFIVETTENNQQLRIQLQRGIADADAVTNRSINSSGLDIMELHSGANTVITHDSTGSQNMGPATASAMNWAGTEDQISSASFTLPSITEIQVERAGNYLFMANGKSTRVNQVDQELRVIQAGNWFINGTEHDLGGHGTYIRGATTGAGGEPVGTFEGSFNAAVIFDSLLITSSIEFRSILEGGTGSLDDNTNADECGFAALNLDLLIPGSQISGDPEQPDVVVVLTSGSSWTVPANFDNQRNYIEIIGGGGGGEGEGRGEGGGGAGYNRINDFDTEGSASIPFQLGQPGSGGDGPVRATDGTATTWHVGGSFEIVAGGGSGSLTGSTIGKGSGLFDGGQGGFSDVFEGGAGGGGAGGPSGSGLAGASGGGNRVGGDGNAGVSGGGLGGGGDGDDGGTGSIWEDTTTGEIAGPGGGGGGGVFQSDQTGGEGGSYGAGGGGGSTDGVNPPGGEGGAGVIVITYRSTIHRFQGSSIDADTSKMNASIFQLRSSAIDSDITPGQLLRQVILGPTQAGNAVMIDEDVLDGRPSFRLAYTAKLIDMDGFVGVPTFDFKLTESVFDSDVVDTRFQTTKRFKGITLDNDQTKAFLRLIHGLDNSIIIDGDGADSEGIITGIRQLTGRVEDLEEIAHLPIPPRDIAFFIDRDPRPFSGSAVIDDNQTQPNTLHGFRLRPIVPGEAEFELIPLRISTKPDFEIVIILSEDDLFAAGLID